MRITNNAELSAIKSQIAKYLYFVVGIDVETITKIIQASRAQVYLYLRQNKKEKK